MDIYIRVSVNSSELAGNVHNDFQLSFAALVFWISFPTASL